MPKANLRDRLLRRAPAVLADAPERAPSGVDRAEFKTALGALAKEHQGNESKLRVALLGALKTELASALETAQTLFLAGRLGGLEAARRISAIHTDILAALYDFTITYILPAANPTKAERMAVCAVGGFGRREMAPGSDLDLLFLQADSKSSAWGESVTEYILYMLWDNIIFRVLRIHDLALFVDRVSTTLSDSN